MIWSCGRFSFDLSSPVVMGILNVTPDSFSDGGLHASAAEALVHARQMTACGAQMIDVGGESTRPGSDEVSIQEELSRVVPVVEALVAEGLAVSVDTRHAPVAQAAVDAGACIVNDVSGMRDEEMRAVVAGSDCGVVIMHMLGEPKTMQASPEYGDVVAEVEAYLLDAAAMMESLGVASGRICIDPGPGFGKSWEHNQKLLEASGRLASHGYPLMVAVSRKSYIGQATGIEAPLQRDEASALAAAAALAQGAHIARVHNVQVTVDAIANSRRAVVALGSNIGLGGADGAGLSGSGDGAGLDAVDDGRVAQLDAAVDALRKTPGVWVSAVSSYYETQPAYLQDQDSFANAVATVQTTLAPEVLLEELHRIENAQGRVRTVANGPRTLDLDIVDYEGVIISDERLTLPHPRALERDFVVTPLLELLPGAVLADGAPVTAEHVRYGQVLGILKQA